MSKGQSLVIQYLLFFIIGITVFFSIGSFFKFQSDIYKRDIVDSGLNMANSQLNGLATAAYNSCRLCDQIEITFKTQNTTAGYPYSIVSNSSGFHSISTLSSQFASSPSHNLNYSLTFSGSSISTKTLTLTLNKNQNRIEVK